MKTLVNLSLFVLYAIVCTAQTAVLLPQPKIQFLNSIGTPLAGGCVQTYAAGTTTNQATFTDSSGNVQNQNPVILDSAGRASIFVSSGVLYRFVVSSFGGINCASGTLQYTQDNVALGSVLTVGGSNTQVQFNQAGVLAGSSNFTWNNATQTLSIGALNTTSGGTLAGVFAGNPIMTGSWSIKALNTIQYADQFAGTDACAKINAAIKALSAQDGVVYAQGIIGAQFCATNPFAGVSASSSGTVYMGGSVISTTASWIIPNKWRVIGIGRGNAADGLNTVIKANIGFPINTPVVQFGASGPIFGVQLNDLGVDCSNISGAIGVQNSFAQEQSGLDHVLIRNCAGTGLLVTNASQNSGPYENLEILNDSACTNCGATTVLANFQSGSAPSGGMHHASLNSNGVPTVPNDALKLDAQGSFSDIHVEYSLRGITIGSQTATAPIALRDTECGPSPTVTTCISISNAFASSSILLEGVGSASGNLLVDNIHGYTDTRNHMAFYLSNTGIFTNTQTNEYLQSLLGNCTTTEYNTVQVGNFTTDAIAGCVDMPITATVHQVDGIAGYVTNHVNIAQSGGAVGGYFQGRQMADNGAAWGSNSLVQDVAGLNAHQIISNEVDVNVLGTPARAWGVLVSGGSTGKRDR